MKTIEKEEYPGYIFHEDGKMFTKKLKKFIDFQTRKDYEYYAVTIRNKNVRISIPEIKSWFKDKEQ
jgi:hypothetical protein